VVLQVQHYHPRMSKLRERRSATLVDGEISDGGRGRQPVAVESASKQIIARNVVQSISELKTAPYHLENFETSCRPLFCLLLSRGFKINGIHAQYLAWQIKGGALQFALVLKHTWCALLNVTISSKLTTTIAQLSKSFHFQIFKPYFSSDIRRCNTGNLKDYFAQIVCYTLWTNQDGRVECRQ
jgi:hypothetical protein